MPDLPPYQLNLPWYEKTAISLGISYAEKRNQIVKKIISELSQPALWATLATAVPLVAQLFTSIGNPHLAALGGAIVAAYGVAIQLKDAFLHVPPPGAVAQKVATHEAATLGVTHAQAAAATTSMAASASHLEALLAKVNTTIEAAEQMARGRQGTTPPTEG